MRTSFLSRVGFAVVVAGMILLNFFEPPLQIVGLVLFTVVLLYPLIDLIWKRIEGTRKERSAGSILEQPSDDDTLMATRTG